MNALKIDDLDICFSNDADELHGKLKVCGHPLQFFTESSEFDVILHTH